VNPTLLGTFLLVTSSAFAGGDDLPDSAVVLDVLQSSFPDYDRIASLSDYERSPIQHLGGWEKNILFGDFNADGAIDFAAKLTRDLKPEELEQISERYRGQIQNVDIVIVCNGPFSSADMKPFKCFEIVGPEIGGFAYLLDTVTWQWNEQFLHEGDSEECRTSINANLGKKSLSLVQPNGLCNVYLYSSESGIYRQCMFCGD
jgi:hypothetical protein